MISGSIVGNTLLRLPAFPSALKYKMYYIAIKMDFFLRGLELLGISHPLLDPPLFSFRSSLPLSDDWTESITTNLSLPHDQVKAPFRLPLWNYFSAPFPLNRSPRYCCQFQRSSLPVLIFFHTQSAFGLLPRSPSLLHVTLHTIKRSRTTLVPTMDG